VSERDRYEVTLRCEGEGCEATAVAVRFRSQAPYEPLPYMCPDCVARRNQR
jgi:hypothetical protein